MDWLSLYHECELVAAARQQNLAAAAGDVSPKLPTKRVVLGMWKESYLRRADVLQASLENAYGEVGVGRWTADLVSRRELSRRLVTHRIPLLFYLGHGRERGWAGYRGLRIHHLEPPPEPMGLVVSLSCRTLEFGRQLVGEGYAQAFLGADDAMGVPGLTKLVSILARVFATESGLPATAADLLSATQQYVSRATSVELKDAWAQLQLLGPGTTQI
jgi:hypothetical protein